MLKKGLIFLDKPWAYNKNFIIFTVSRQTLELYHLIYLLFTSHGTVAYISNIFYTPKIENLSFFNFGPILSS